MKQALTVKELATKIVGDGKKPNKYFVTIGYGWYFPNESEEMIQVKDSLDSVTVMLTNKEDAIKLYNSIIIRTISPVTKETIGQVMIEDRLTGVIKEKCLTMLDNGKLVIDHI